MSELESPAQGVALGEAEREALEFECALLRREAVRLVATNRALEVQLSRLEAELDGLREYLGLMEHSLPWRVAQRIRSWFGRAW
jgi:hypothetical protein